MGTAALKTRLVLAIVIWMCTSEAWAQNAQALLQQIRQANLAGRPSPDDIVLIGDVRDPSGAVKPVRIAIKGSDKVRYETGSGTNVRTTVFNAGAGWLFEKDKTNSLKPQSAQRRPALIPFLDLLSELNNPRLEVTDRGVYMIGNTATRRITLRLPDAQASQRELRWALDEEVDFYIDPRTLLVLRSERLRRADNNLEMRVPSVLEFSDYRNVGGIVLPFRVVNTMGTSETGLQQWTYAFQSAALNSGVSDLEFQPRIQGQGR